MAKQLTEEITVEKTQVNVPVMAADQETYEIQITFKGFQVDNDKCAEVITAVCEVLDQKCGGAKVKHNSDVKSIIVKEADPTIFGEQPY